jgi:glc operon protein GlcG
MMALTLAEIERMLQAAKKKALDMGVIVGISIVDARGDLLAALRLDGALWRTMPVSRGKAYASVAFGVSSGELTERANNPVMRALMLMEEGQIIPQQGAVPIKRGNELLGAIGVSGARSEEDEEIARAGVGVL